MATRYGHRRVGINRAHRREKCGLRATRERAAAWSHAHRDRACSRAQFYMIHKRARLRERVTPGEFHFVDFWG
jgi:hypothetical protein